MRRLIALVAAIAAAGLTASLAGHEGASRAAGQLNVEPPTGADAFEPVLGMSVLKPVVFGASAQAPGETWAYGTLGAVPASIDGASYANQVVLLQHAANGGWRMVPLPSRPSGQQPSGNGMPYALGALGGRVTPAGGVVTLTEAGIVTIDPVGPPRLIPQPGSGEKGEPPLSELLGNGETLPPAPAPGGSATPYAALDEPAGKTGLLIAPYGDGANAGGSGLELGVLHYDGSSWSREPIAWKGTAKEPLTPQALACGPEQAGMSSTSSTPSCWLLASYQAAGEGETGRLALFRRVANKSVPAGYSWENVKVNDWLLGAAALPTGVTSRPSVATLGATAQTLTVTAQGVWVDFAAKVAGSHKATDFTELVLPEGEGAAESVAGHWCFGAPAPGCEQTLEEPLPPQYGSFATAGNSPGDPGTRVITGLRGGDLLELYGGSFHDEPGAGGDSGGVGGAAFPSGGQRLTEGGWLGQADTYSQDSHGAASMLHLTHDPQGDQLTEQPLPFRRPLLAVTQAPGTAPGDPNAPAIAVGAGGEIGRYTPGEGWSPEALYNSNGEAQTPTLRSVAWPQANLAYAVGDNGTMWVWRAETGLWKPDPSAPYNFIGNLTGIAFDPTQPQLGYAVGKQGVLLSYGKTWEPISTAERQQLEAELKVEEQQLNFTSVVFAGGQALATYRMFGPSGETGGLLINEERGGGWRVDTSASQLLSQLFEGGGTVLSKVAGLPDGGAVVAGPGIVIERESDSDQWRLSPQPLPEAQNVSALAAFREGGAIRALISIDLDVYSNPSANPFRCDFALPTGAGQPLPHLCPDPLPITGYLLRQTASGWEDMEHMAFNETASSQPKDEPARPDPVLALTSSPSGGVGLAVGGQTGGTDGETSAAMRFGATLPSAGADTQAPIVTSAKAATFALGGEAACEQACASFANEDLAPDVLLSHALQSAKQIALSSPGGLRGFIYTGDRLKSKLSSLPPEAQTFELGRYASLLASGGSGSPPVYAAAAPDDLGPSSAGLSAFTTALAPYLPEVQPGSSSAYYSLTCPGSPGCPVTTTGGTVKMIVLDYSHEELGEVQLKWLEDELKAAQEARVPSLVVGNAALGFGLPESIGFDTGPQEAKDAASVLEILCKHEASTYLFDYPGANVQTQASCGGAHHLTEIGSGALGYSSPPAPRQTDSLGSSSFVLIEMDTGKREPQFHDVVPVHALVEPDIAQLALDATDGTLLRRSHVGLFDALARIPQSGVSVVKLPNESFIQLGPEPYEPIPFDCNGPNCADQVPTDYSFSSSKPDVGGFVLHEAGSTEAHQVQLGAHQKPIPDEARNSRGELIASGRFEENAKGEAVNEKGEVVPREQSGLFCAYNEGTTVVSITTGGLTYSMPVTVQGGSTEYPCGTVPLKNPPALAVPESSQLEPIQPEPAKGSPPFVPPIHIAVPQAPLPAPQQAPHPKPPRAAAPFLPFLAPTAGLVQLRPAILPPPPPAGRPSPPSGTSSAQVYQSAYAPESEREEEPATDLVHNFAAYESSAPSPLSLRQALYGLPLLILLLAFAGARVDRLLRPGRRALAKQTVRR